ncbi:MAG: alpha/beta hydrolase [Rhizobiales bacterium]|nr:alpha/beta hydrolase [Hyphomicrobiales bacterium]
MIEAAPANPALRDGPPNAPLVVLMHGAGAPMDSRPMTGLAEAIAARGLAVLRFELAYMAARRGGRRPPPPRVQHLMAEIEERLDGLLEPHEIPITAGGHPLVILAGKSMGGRLATMLADRLAVAGRIVAAAAFGYPFFPPGKARTPTLVATRTGHLTAMSTPTLIVQGTRDRFGGRADVAGLSFARHVRFAWIEGGDHDLVPARAIGRSPEDAWREAAGHLAAFAAEID